MTKLGDLYDLKVDQDGKVRVQKNEKRALAKLPVNKRIAKRNSKKIKPVKRKVT